MTRRTDASIMRSPLARRILLLFFSCALLPVALAAALGYRHVVATLHEQGLARLHQNSKTLSMGVLERLLLIESELELVALQLDGARRADEARPLASSHVDDHFTGISLISADGAVARVLGRPVQPRPLTPLELAHVASGRSLVLAEPAEGLFGMVVMVRQSRVVPGAQIWGTIDVEYLWGVGARNTLPPRTELCVLDTDMEILIRSTGVPRSLGDRVEAHVLESDQRWFEWRSDGRAYLAGLWRIPLKTPYLVDSWTVVLSEERESIFLPAAGFKRDFPLILLLSLWLVLLLSIRQIRRSLHPLRRLLEGTRRVADRDFSHPVVVKSSDEFQEVARAFNDMTLQLGRQFAVLSILESIGRGVLGADGMEAIARSTLARLYHLFPASRASISFLESSTGTQAVTFWNLASMPDEVHRTVHPIEEIPSLDQLREGARVHLRDVRVPSPAFLATSGLEETRSRIAQPLRDEGRLLGAVVLDATSPDAFVGDHLRHAAEISDQLSLALRETGLRSAVEAERHRLAQLLEYLPSGVILLDREHRIVLANRLARRSLPLLSEAAVGDEVVSFGGHPLAQLLGDERRSQRREITVEEPRRAVFEIAAGQLEIRPNATATVIVFSDITQERETEERLQRQNRLAAVGQLAAGIAHDFNNILQGIVMAGDLLKALPSDRRNVNRLSDNITSEAHRGATLIRQILDFSRRSSTARKPLDVALVAEETVELLERTLPENISLTVETPPSPCVILGDRGQLQQVITNLALNARDAMPDGGRLRIGVTPSSTPPSWNRAESPELVADWIVVSCTDTGSGISSSVGDRIFEPFFTTKTEGQGTGLGLAQVYGIVSQHHGHIDYESTSSGTTFRVWFPRADVTIGTSETEADEDVPRGNGELILVTENIPTLLRTTAQALEKLGYRVLRAGSGTQACRRVEDASEPLRLLITDMMMPGMSGTELIRHLRERHPDLPVILMTGLFTDTEPETDVDIDGLLLKPFSMELLAHAVNRALRSG